MTVFLFVARLMVKQAFFSHESIMGVGMSCNS